MTPSFLYFPTVASKSFILTFCQTGYQVTSVCFPVPINHTNNDYYILNVTMIIFMAHQAIPNFKQELSNRNYVIMVKASVGQEFGQGTVGMVSMACLHSTVTRASAEKSRMAAEGLESFGGICSQHPHRASPYDLCFFKTFQPQGSWTSHMITRSSHHCVPKIRHKLHCLPWPSLRTHTASAILH